MGERGLPVTIVHACLRDGAGGSPTAVVDEAEPGAARLSDAERCRVPALTGTSHAVFVSARPVGPAREGACGRPEVSLRFFTAEGELPACGHGTVAALALLAGRAGGGAYRAALRTARRSFTGWCTPGEPHVTAAFGPGPVALREPTASECALVLPALGVTSGALAPGVRAASVGRSRLLVPVTTRSALAALDPDLERLRAACDRVGLLGCYVYSVPTAGGRAAARMFAPSIGVPEDIANANSTACLAADLAGRGVTGIAVDMGDSLGSPATVTATARPGHSGPLIRVGGSARITGTTYVTLP
jgi:PhzF family phenazine biosynthesis protein